MDNKGTRSFKHVKLEMSASKRYGVGSWIYESRFQETELKINVKIIGLQMAF